MNRRWLQFRLRTLLLMIPVFCALLAWGVSGYRRQLEYHRAWYDLAVLDMGSRIGADIRFYSPRTEWREHDVDELLRIIGILGRRRDFGFKKGISIAVIDFKGSQISEKSILRIREAVANTTVIR